MSAMGERVVEQTPRCGECQGSLEKRTIDHAVTSNGKGYIFENVPAFVCLNCGAPWFTAEVSQSSWRNTTQKETRRSEVKPMV